jgi:transposase
MVIETLRLIARGTEELGINEGTLGNWVSVCRCEHAGEEPALTINERARPRALTLMIHAVGGLAGDGG